MYFKFRIKLVKNITKNQVCNQKAGFLDLGLTFHVIFL